MLTRGPILLDVEARRVQGAVTLFLSEMRPATVFALHLGRLFSQVVHDPQNQEPSRTIVDELLAEHRDAVTLTWDNWQLLAGSEVLPTSMPGIRDVLARMAAHGVREMTFAAGVEPGDVLGAVWILARDPVIGDGGANAVASLARLGTSRVRFVAVTALPAPPPLATPATTDAVVSLEFELQELEVPPVEAPRRDSGAVAVPPVSRADQSNQQFSSAVETPAVLIGRLKTLTNVEQLAQTLEAISTLIAEARAAQRISEAATMLTAVVASAPRFTDPEAKRVYSQLLRRMVSGPLLLTLAADLPRARERHAQYMALFARFGEEAAEALIEQLVYAELARERRVLFNAIVELRRGESTLIRMLSDARWYVARNAAELLGEMRAAASEASLVRCLRHDDARVRRSSAAALAKLASPGALSALSDALTDPSPNVRMQASLAIAMRREPRTTALLLRALDDEDDADVRRVLLSALGKHGTPEAVKRLTAEAEPDPRLFRKRPVGARVAAVQGLAEARTPDALVALQALTKDRTREVRDAATKALTGTSAQPRRPTDW